MLIPIRWEFRPWKSKLFTEPDNESISTSFCHAGDKDDRAFIQANTFVHDFGEDQIVLVPAATSYDNCVIEIFYCFMRKCLALEKDRIAPVLL